MKPTFFPTQEKFRAWLENNYQTETELLVGFYRVSTKKPCMSWSESVDQALCFGWIDGIRKSIDEESYTIRFTPRKKSSIWSAINIKKVEQLTKAGLMKEAGLKAFEFRSEERSGIYSHEKEAYILSIDLEKQFKANTIAWEYFDKQAPSYKKVMIHWIMSAKLEKTRISRLEKAISTSAEQKRML
ncbi:YdeI/OmpD-associated family protein [Flavobacterium pectinovorum]|uniref:YdeI/OmpD-associated family protein n=1 Tax=Flavobacterium pectinovorum TaxID=29533 RepID=UPI001FABF8D9|nr:YdeI/OmpD-associated family protein [Flavobacterium pectinovorum]MCI9844432.1 YdeI/OmpD-associated family protein [Flavobacterium pectinovorum]